MGKFFLCFTEPSLPHVVLSPRRPNLCVLMARSNIQHTMVPQNYSPLHPVPETGVSGNGIIQQLSVTITGSSYNVIHFVGFLIVIFKALGNQFHGSWWNCHFSGIFNFPPYQDNSLRKHIDS